MTCWIEEDSGGRDCIFCNSAEVGADVRKTAIHTDHVFVRLSDGQVFTSGTPLPRLSPAEAEMVEYYEDERGMPILHIFSGEPSVEDEPSVG